MPRWICHFFLERAVIFFERIRNYCNLLFGARNDANSSRMHSRVFSFLAAISRQSNLTIVMLLYNITTNDRPYMPFIKNWARWRRFKRLFHLNLSCYNIPSLWDAAACEYSGTTIWKPRNCHHLLLLWRTQDEKMFATEIMLTWLGWVFQIPSGNNMFHFSVEMFLASSMNTGVGATTASCELVS